MTMNAQDKWLKLDLQMFSEGEEVIRGGYNPEAEISFPEPSSNPLLQDDSGSDEPQFQPEPGTEPEPQTEPVQEPEPQLFDFGGRKVDPNNPETIRGAYEDFQRAQQYITQLSQQNQMLMQQQQQFQQMQQQFQQQQPEPQAEPFDADAFMEKFYENPDVALSDYTQKAIQKAISEIEAKYEPIVKERQYNAEIMQIEAKYPDFGDAIPEIQNLIHERGEQFVEQIGLENAYLMAKGRMSASQPQQQPMTPESLLQDPNFIQQLTSNEQVRNMILQQTMQQKQEQRPPQVIKNNVGGAVPLTPQNRPKTLAEASKLWRESQGIY